MKLKSILTRSRLTDGRRRRRRAPSVILTLGVLLAGAGAVAADQAAKPDDKLPQITLKGGRFDPLELVVPANTAFKLLVTNSDPDAIEFESFELHRERVVGPGETITVFMPSLSPGTYKFFDDFHNSTPNGVIVAK
jgi:hypothetical protein